MISTQVEGNIAELRAALRHAADPMFPAGAVRQTAPLHLVIGRFVDWPVLNDTDRARVNLCVERWAAALRPFAKTAAATRRAGGQQKVLAQMKAKGPLRLQDVQVMMHSLNAKISAKKLKLTFAAADADKRGKLEWGELKKLFKALRSRPACLPTLFAAACPEGKTELRAADLRQGPAAAGTTRGLPTRGGPARSGPPSRRHICGAASTWRVSGAP